LTAIFIIIYNIYHNHYYVIITFSPPYLSYYHTYHHIHIIGAVLPIGEVSGIAYKRIRCPLSLDARNGTPNHTNFNLVRNILSSYFGFSSILLNYFYDYFHINYNNNNNNDNEYLSEAEQDEEDLFFDQVDEE
jgi:hypothetical protein